MFKENIINLTYLHSKYGVLNPFFGLDLIDPQSDYYHQPAEVSAEEHHAGAGASEIYLARQPGVA